MCESRHHDEPARVVVGWLLAGLHGPPILTPQPLTAADAHTNTDTTNQGRLTTSRVGGMLGFYEPKAAGILRGERRDAF